jgi:Domain of unknown function (DUF4160)
MPTVSFFFGIMIRMYLRDHGIPHFHAIYQGDDAVFDIATGEVVEGSLPKAATRIVREWTIAHREDLLANWDRARARQPLERIPGADND